MNSKVIIISAAMAALAMGCKSKKVVVEPPPPEPVVEPAPEPKKTLTLNKANVGHVKITDDHLEIDQKIHFGTDSDVIQPDSNGLLEEIGTVLKDHKEISVLHVIGHTDSKGDDAHNMELSERRAASVVKALRALGVEQTIDSKGAGETQPACTEDTDECHEKNRRVEFVIEKSKN